MVKAHTRILAYLCTQQILETPLPACVPVGIHSYFPAKKVEEAGDPGMQ